MIYKTEVAFSFQSKKTVFWVQQISIGRLFHALRAAVQDDYSPNL